MTTFRPLLAATADLAKIKFPCFVSPKLDGIRALSINGKAMTRSMKELPNRYIQSIFASGLYDGLDGEIIVGPPNASDVYRVTNSAVMTRDGEPTFTYHVFDRWDMPDYGFEDRYRGLHEIDVKHIRVVPHTIVSNLTQLNDYEAQCLANGYEGVMGRALDGGYKQGDPRCVTEFCGS